MGLRNNVDSLPKTHAGKIVGYEDNVNVAAFTVCAGGKGSVKHDLLRFDTPCFDSFVESFNYV